uniref:histidine--tRNA ligase n=1 Tax=Balbiania investiens TaxID=111861 RepID=A0A4D6BKP7_9FLOR|nr:Histidine-tRNA ligase [Balbiania investiens]QBX88566.1 Histidine-tRNA ligase [Balbiania investiens]
MRSTRGMHDILPDEIEYWQYIYNVAINILGTANYREIRTPIMENTSLFRRSIGKDTDIVNKEMYSFTDQGERELTLRPEGTASIARAVMEHKLAYDTQIQKLWYLGPMFRYERPQYGRQRQFHQLGLEYFGSDNPLVDAEIIYLAEYFLKHVSCQDYRIEINSIGTVKDRMQYKVKLQEFLLPYTDDLDIESRMRLNVNPIRILDTKSQRTQAILTEAPKLIDYLDTRELTHFEMVKEYLEVLGVKTIINPHLVRGLDYYNSTAFEIKTDKLGTQDTICGGGRYDGLIKEIGGDHTPAIGWAIGVERLLLLIKENIKLQQTPLCFYIVTEGYEAKKYALAIVQKIQEAELKFELDISDSTFQKQIKKGNRKGAMICIIIGQDEVERNMITLKWLKEYKQITYYLKDFENDLIDIKERYKSNLRL